MLSEYTLDLWDRGGFPEICAVELDAIAHEVSVAIGEARQNGRSAQVPCLRVFSCDREYVAVCSNLGDMSVLNRECLNLRA